MHLEELFFGQLDSPFARWPATDPKLRSFPFRLSALAATCSRRAHTAKKQRQPSDGAASSRLDI